MFRRLLPALLLSVLPLANGCYDSHFGQTGEAPGEGSPNASLADIRARFTGQPVVVEGDIRVAGRVTTSDRAGNFYRTLCIEDAGAALEVMVGLDHLHNDYPPGSLLLVRLRGLTLGEQFGVLQAGGPAEPGSGYATGFLGSKAAAGLVAGPEAARRCGSRTARRRRAARSGGNDHSRTRPVDVRHARPHPRRGAVRRGGAGGMGRIPSLRRRAGQPHPNLRTHLCRLRRSIDTRRAGLADRHFAAGRHGRRPIHTQTEG